MPEWQDGFDEIGVVERAASPACDRAGETKSNLLVETKLEVKNDPLAKEALGLKNALIQAGNTWVALVFIAMVTATGSGLGLREPPTEFSLHCLLARVLASVAMIAFAAYGASVARGQIEVSNEAWMICDYLRRGAETPTEAQLYRVTESHARLLLISSWVVILFSPCLVLTMWI